MCHSGRRIEPMPNTYGREYVERYKEAHGGLTPAGMTYRKQHGLDPDAPQRNYVRGKPGVKRIKLTEGNPGQCFTIGNGWGRPEPCILCGAYNVKKYLKCLDFADENNWFGWQIK
jgi:hypothetical protein